MAVWRLRSDPGYVEVNAAFTEGGVWEPMSRS